MTVPYLSLEHPIRFAHRGSRVLWPENTMHAFDAAVSGLGYRYLELDVRCSGDGVPMVFHDATLERTTNAAGPITDWRAEDLRSLDAAYRFGEDEGFPLRGSGIGIPTLEDVFSTFPGVHVNIDLKAPDIEWQVAEVILELGAEDRALIGSFHDVRIAKFRRITKGRVAVSAGPRAVAAMYTASRFGLAAPGRFQAYQIPFRVGVIEVSRRMVDAVHRAGAHLHLWTVNEPEDMRKYLELGVDGIVTDRPDLLNEVLAERGDRG